MISAPSGSQHPFNVVLLTYESGEKQLVETRLRALNKLGGTQFHNSITYVTASAAAAAAAVVSFAVGQRPPDVGVY